MIVCLSAIWRLAARRRLPFNVYATNQARNFKERQVEKENKLFRVGRELRQRESAAKNFSLGRRSSPKQVLASSGLFARWQRS